MRGKNFWCFILAIVLVVLIQRRKPRAAAITRAGLLLPSSSPIAQVLASADTSTFVTTFGINRAIFDELCPLFSNRFNLSSRRFCHFSPILRLGITLVWLRSSAEQQFLCFFCGVIPSTLSNVLHESMPILRDILSTIPECEVVFPNEFRIKQLAAVMELDFPELRGGFAFVDGTMIKIPHIGSEVEQHAYYCIRKSHHAVNNVFIFGVDGIILAACLNSPGSWHDSEVCRVGGLYENIRSIPEGYFVIGDSAFATKECGTKMKTTRTNSAEVVSPFLSALCSARQSVEWGMRAYKSTFRRFSRTLDVRDHQYRKIVFDVSVLLFNLRTKRVGRNQIRTVWMNLLEQDNDLF